MLGGGFRAASETSANPICGVGFAMTEVVSKRHVRAVDIVSKSKCPKTQGLTV